MAKDAPYQFYMDKALKEKGINKSKDNSVPIAPFMLMAFEQFIDRPIEESIRRLKAHNNRMRRKKMKIKGAKVTL